MHYFGYINVIVRSPLTTVSVLSQKQILIQGITFKENFYQERKVHLPKSKFYENNNNNLYIHMCIYTCQNYSKHGSFVMGIQYSTLIIRTLMLEA